MMRRLTLGSMCLALAFLLTLLARDVWRAEQGLRDGDARAEVAPVDRRSWESTQTFPAGIARDLLGIEDDIEYRVHIERAIRLARVPAQTPAQARRRAPVEAALRRIAVGTNTKRAAQAALLLGVLFYTGPEDPYRRSETPIEKALEQFRSAVQLDPTNETAKFNLELLLHQERSRSARGRSARAGGDRPGGGAAGLAPAGRGY